MSARARRPRRTWAQRAFLAFTSGMIVTCLLVAGGLAYTYSKVSDISRVQLQQVLSTDKRAGRSTPENVLIVGTDSADGLAPDDPVLYGRPPGIRSDTIMVLRVDPSNQRAQLLSLPRDLYVPIAGTRGSDRINSAIQAGPERLVETIKQDFGIPINHYIEINFYAFETIVKAIDGIPIYFPYPARDEKSGLDVPNAGCVTLDPSQALAFARSRAYEELVNGRWRTDPTGDLGRISRQQLFIKRVLSRSIAKGARNPTVLNDLFDAAVGSVHLDPTLTVGDVLDLGQRFRSFNPDNLDTYSVPATGANVRGADVLKVDPVRAEPILRLFRDVEGELSPNTAVVAAVYNGSGAPNQGQQAAADLRARGFTIPADEVGDADRFDYPTTVWYAKGKQAEANLIASYLRSGAVVAPSPVPLLLADVIVITGTDYSGVLDQPNTPATASTTTTVPTIEGTQPTTTTLVGTVPTTPQDVSC